MYICVIDERVEEIKMDSWIKEGKRLEKYNSKQYKNKDFPATKNLAKKTDTQKYNSGVRISKLGVGPKKRLLKKFKLKKDG